MVTTNWPPFYSENMPNGGPLTQVSIEAFGRVGYQVKIEFVPWSRAIMYVETGKTDALLGAYKNPDRQKFAYFTQSILGKSRASIIARKDSNIVFSSFEELNPFVIGILRGSSVSEKFDLAKGHLGITEHDSEVKLIELLESGRLDLIAGSEQVFFSEYKTRYTNRKPREFLKSIVILNSEPMYNIFSKNTTDGKKLRDAFDLGFSMIVEDGTYHKIMHEHGLE